LHDHGAQSSPEPEAGSIDNGNASTLAVPTLVDDLLVEV